MVILFFQLRKKEILRLNILVLDNLQLCTLRRVFDICVSHLMLTLLFHYTFSPEDLVKPVNIRENSIDIFSESIFLQYYSCPKLQMHIQELVSTRIYQYLIQRMAWLPSLISDLYDFAFYHCFKRTNQDVYDFRQTELKCHWNQIRVRSNFFKTSELLYCSD